MVRTLDTYRNDGDDFPSMPKGVLLYVLGTDEKSCTERIEYVLGLAVSDQQKLVSQVPPVSATGWIADDCGGGYTERTDDPPSFEADGTTTDPDPNPNPNPTPTVNNDDQAGETLIGFVQG